MKLKNKRLKLSSEKAPESYSLHDENSDESQSTVDEFDENEDSGDDNQISEYEKRVLKNIEERNKFLAAMGFPEAVKELKSSLQRHTPTVKKSSALPKQSRTFTPKVSPLPPREPSRRIRKLAVEKEIKLETSQKEEEKEEEHVDDRFLGSMKMEGNLHVFTNLNSDTKHNPDLDLSTCTTTELRDQIASLKLLKLQKIGRGSKAQAVQIHPTMVKPLIFVGHSDGTLGIWDAVVEDEESAVNVHRLHRAPLNCIKCSVDDSSRLFTASHDGTVTQIDLNTAKFTNIFATDFNQKVSHLTWLDELNSHSLLVAHGEGRVGLLDHRAGKSMQKWIECFDRSVRTVQRHPIQDQMFLASSGTGSFKIFDLRNSECVVMSEHPKGLTSAFFSHSGTSIVSTCNDDFVRVFDSRDLSGRKLPKMASHPHNNHTGRWLSVFKATWVPQRDDAFHIGSLMQPRRLQFYKTDGEGLLLEVADENLSTVCSVIAMHPTLPIVAGANSSGKVHLFGPPKLIE